jgi:thioredoxin-related protein
VGALRRTIAEISAGGFILFAAICGFTPPAQALELLMVKASWCAYCLKFEREVLPIYDETSLGQDIPIHLVELGLQDRLRFHFEAPIAAVPTFVLIDDDNNEVSRFSGYSDVASFFQVLKYHANSDLN